MRRVHVLSNAAKRFTAKLALKFGGLFKIVEVQSPMVYVLDAGLDGSSRWLALTHVSKLKCYIPPRGSSTNKKH